MVGWHPQPWTISLSESMDISLSELWEIVKDKRDLCAAVHGVTKSWTQLSTKQQLQE